MKTFASLFLILLLSVSALAQTKTLQQPAFTVEITGKGEPLYLLPGATCSGKVWKETVAHYQDRYECHVITFAGYAGTPALAQGPYLPTIKAAIQAYIQKNSPKGALLMGHSIGGYTAMWIAADAPQLVKKLIIVDALPYLRGSMNPYAPEGDPKAAAEQYLGMISQLDSATFAQSQLQVLQGMIKDSTRWQEALGWSLASDKRTLAYTVNEMMHQDLRDDIARISAPTLVLGQYDGPFPQYPGFTLESIKNNLTQQYAALPRQEIKIKQGARHFIMFDAPDWFFQQVDGFLSTQP